MLEILQSFINLIKACQDQFQTICRNLCKINYWAKYAMMSAPTFTKSLGYQALGLVKNQMFLKINDSAFLKKIKVVYAFKFIVPATYH